MTRKKILLVDDCPTTLLMEEMVLRGERYQLVSARNGLEAIERVDAERPDLILLDIVMPGMNGLEACREIRKRPYSQNVPIIMVTSRRESDKAALPDSGHDYILKPINGAELLGKVRGYLGS